MLARQPTRIQHQFSREDLGGISLTRGGSTRRGTLYRSATFHAATAPRAAMIAVLGEMRREWGNMANYATASGASPASISALRQSLVDGLVDGV